MEWLDIVDERGVPTGRTADRDRIHREGLPHRTVHVWIVRKAGQETQVLLQKRSLNKESFPGLYDTSCAGHVPAGETPMQAAQRELQEELGLCASPEDLAYAGSIRIRYERFFGTKLFRDNEFTDVFLFRPEVGIGQMSLQEEEISEVRWFSLREVCDEIRTDRHRFCVPSEGLETLIRFLHLCPGKFSSDPAGIPDRQDRPEPMPTEKDRQKKQKGAPDIDTDRPLLL